MKRLVTDTLLLKTPDGEHVRLWLEAHSLNPSFITLAQTIEFEPGHIWLDMYRERLGVLVFENNEPKIYRHHHTCRMACQRYDIEGLLEVYRVESI